MRPDEAGDWDLRLPDLLASYDEALAAGHAPSTAQDKSLPTEFRARLARMQACLARLEQDRLRFESCSLADGPTTPAEAALAGETHVVAPPRLGPFRILRILGSGGFGVVYLAEDPRLGRRVAVKVPRPDALVTPHLRRRFLREARAAARLHHTNIVPIFDVGEAGAFCYIVSAYCSAGTLAAWLKNRSKPVPVRSAAYLTAVLADGVQHAHDHGILHRDLKPGNVLLRPEETTPAAGQDGIGFTPLIADFGLAKIVDLASDVSPPPSCAPEELPAAAELSQDMTRGPAGTPEYMAPEQAATNHAAVDRPADVYALGCILYQLLTGRPPFAGAAPDVMRRVHDEQPTPPGRLRPGVPRDLATICLKCLRKEPVDRYPSARQLADDLRRWLAGEPVRARPAGPLRRSVKWMRRRPAAAGLIALSLVTVLGSSGGTLWYAWARAREEHRQRHATYVEQIRQAQQTLEDGDFHGLTELMNGLRPPPGGPDLRGFEWHYLWRKYQEAGLWLSGHEEPVSGIAFSSDGQTLVSSGGEGKVRLWDPHRAALLATLQEHPETVGPIVLSPDGKTLAAVNRDNSVSLWDLSARRFKTTLRHPEGIGNALGFSPAGDLLATSGGGPAVFIWDLATGRVLAQLQHASTVNGVAFTPDGKCLISAESEGTIRRWDTSTGRQMAKGPARAHDVCCTLIISPDGRMLASGGKANDIALWDAQTLTPRARLAGPGGTVAHLAFSQDGRLLAVGSIRPHPRPKTAVQIWDVAETLRPLASAPLPAATFDMPDADIGPITFSPDSQTVALACSDRLVRLWRPVLPSQKPAAMSHAPDEAWAVAFAPDGKLVASAGDNEKGSPCLKAWDASSGRLQWTAAGHTQLATCLAFSPDGSVLTSASYDNRIKLWDPATGRERANLDAQLNQPRCLAFSSDGRLLACGGGRRLHSAGGDRVAHVWDVTTERLLHTFGGHGEQVRGVVFSPDGRQLITTEDTQMVRFWEIETGRELRSFSEMSQVQCVAYAPDGKSAAWGMQYGTLTRFDLESGQTRSFAGRHQGEIRSLAFTPDGRRLATGGSDSTVRLWDTETLNQLLILPAGALPINSVAFSPAGDRLASAGHDGAIRIWHAPKEE
jgi:WD40 repeat protein/serine/threonine protein kinase